MVVEPECSVSLDLAKGTELGRDSDALGPCSALPMAAASSEGFDGRTSSSRYSSRTTKATGTVPLAVSDFKEYSRRVCQLYAASGAIILGNVLEWYDWTVYGYMEDLISELFMNGGHSATWFVFGLSFVARPLGSILLGWVGDRWGRTIALNIAIWAMAASTVVTGCLVPGVPGTTEALIVLRLMSGLSAGGEAAGVNTYMSEVGGPERDHTLVAAVGVNNISGALAFFMANAVSLAVHLLPRTEQLSWGWRMPFLLAAPIGLASVLLRRQLHETEDFKSIQAARLERSGKEDSDLDSDVRDCPEHTASIASASDNGFQEGHFENVLSDVATGTSSDEGQPVVTAKLNMHSQPKCTYQDVVRSLVLCVLVMGASTSWNYLPVYLAQWLQTNCGFTPTTALSLSAVAKIVQLLMTFPVSCFGDRFGLVAAMILGNVTSASLALPCFLLIVFVSAADSSVGEPGTQAVASAGVEVLAFLVLGVVLPSCMTFFVVPGMLYVNCIFPAHLRSRGAGLGYGLAATVGGFTPAICSALAVSGAWFPALFITLQTLPSLATLLWSKRAASRGALPVYQRAWLF